MSLHMFTDHLDILFCELSINIFSIFLLGCLVIWYFVFCLCCCCCHLLFVFYCALEVLFIFGCKLFVRCVTNVFSLLCDLSFLLLMSLNVSSDSCSEIQRSLFPVACFKISFPGQGSKG